MATSQSLRLLWVLLLASSCLALFLLYRLGPHPNHIRPGRIIANDRTLVPPKRHAGILPQEEILGELPGRKYDKHDIHQQSKKPLWGLVNHGPRDKHITDVVNDGETSMEGVIEPDRPHHPHHPRTPPPSPSQPQPQPPVARNKPRYETSAGVAQHVKHIKSLAVLWKELHVKIGDLRTNISDARSRQNAYQGGSHNAANPSKEGQGRGDRPDVLWNATVGNSHMAVAMDAEIRRLGDEIDGALASLGDTRVGGEGAAIGQAWRTLRAKKHILLEEKIRLQKEQGQWGAPSRRPLGPRSPLPPADPAQWQGLNSSRVEAQFPGIRMGRDYRLRHFLDTDIRASDEAAPPRHLNNLTDAQAEERFYQLLTMTHLDCGDIWRLGETGDGGWDLCVVDPFTPHNDCLVYSFGINYDFAFEDSIASKFGCQVRSFDPSMNIGDHMHSAQVYFYQLGLGPAISVTLDGWRLENLGSILGKLKHLNRSIDVLKLDIEFNEWRCLATMIREGALRHVKQLCLEVHTPEVYLVGRPSTRQDFWDMYQQLHDLERQGFRRFHFTENPTGAYKSVRTGQRRSCCYELYYVNIAFLH